MNLEALRARIDEIDRQLLTLLDERMRCATDAAKFKGSIRDEARERQILQTVAAMSLANLDPQFRTRLYEMIFAEGVRLQENIMKREGKD